MTPPPHECPGCGRPDVPFEHLACHDCWYRLPATLRRAVNGTVRRGGEAHAAALRMAHRWYQRNPAPKET